MADNSPGNKFEFSNHAPDVCDGIGSCIDQAKVEKYNHIVGPDVPSSPKCSVSLQRQQRRQMSAARRKASVISLRDTSYQLYTLVDGVAGHVDGEADHAFPPTVNCSLRDKRNVSR